MPTKSIHESSTEDLIFALYEAERELNRLSFEHAERIRQPQPDQPVVTIHNKALNDIRSKVKMLDSAIKHRQYVESALRLKNVRATQEAERGI